MFLAVDKLDSDGQLVAIVMSCFHLHTL